MARDYGKRDPSSHRTLEQIHAMDHGYEHQPKMIKHRSANNQARTKLVKLGKLRKGDGLDAGHKKSLDKGGSNSLSNLKVQTQKDNRGWRRDGPQPK